MGDTICRYHESILLPGRLEFRSRKEQRASHLSQDLRGMALLNYFFVCFLCFSGQKGQHSCWSGRWRNFQSVHLVKYRLELSLEGFLFATNLAATLWKKWGHCWNAFLHVKHWTSLRIVIDFRLWSYAVPVGWRQLLRFASIIAAFKNTENQM